MAERPKRFVYLLQSLVASDRTYVGLTSDVNARLRDHNAGQNPSTARHKPWRVLVMVEFGSEHGAVSFERYLKTGSGRALARRHLRCDMWATQFRKSSHTACQPSPNAPCVASTRVSLDPGSWDAASECPVRGGAEGKAAPTLPFSSDEMQRILAVATLIPGTPIG